MTLITAGPEQAALISTQGAAYWRAEWQTPPAQVPPEDAATGAFTPPLAPREVLERQARNESYVAWLATALSVKLASHELGPFLPEDVSDVVEGLREEPNPQVVSDAGSILSTILTPDIPAPSESAVQARDSIDPSTSELAKIRRELAMAETTRKTARHAGDLAAVETLNLLITTLKQRLSSSPDLLQ